MASPISDSNSNSIENRDQNQLIDELPSNDCSLVDRSSNQASTSDPEPANHESEPSPGSNIRRRRISGLEPTDLNSESPAPSGDGSNNLQCDSNDKDREIKRTESREASSLVPTIDDGPVDQFGESSSNLIELIAGFVIKAMGFQINLMFRFFTFPLWLLYKSVTDPIGTMRNGMDYVYEESSRVWDSFVCDWLGENKSIWDLFRQYGWGLLWAAYACFMLFGFMVSSFVVGGIWMHYLVEEPIHIEEALNFDYTMRSPQAFVPVTSCADIGCGMRCIETSEMRKSRGLRARHSGKHKFHASATLVMPESEYNRKLGMFQVRVDFLSANGTTISSSSQPCMLHFKSDPIRLFLTLFKAAPLLTGYISESQTLNLKFASFTEGNVPTACLKVILQQRAEYPPGAGIPEVYDASLTLESELPPLRSFIWRWKRTVFVWISITSLLMELLLAVIFCRPIIIPR